MDCYIITITENKEICLAHVSWIGERRYILWCCGESSWVSPRNTNISV